MYLSHDRYHVVTAFPVFDTDPNRPLTEVLDRDEVLQLVERIGWGEIENHFSTESRDDADYKLILAKEKLRDRLDSMKDIRGNPLYQSSGQKRAELLTSHWKYPTLNTENWEEEINDPQSVGKRSAKKGTVTKPSGLWEKVDNAKRRNTRCANGTCSSTTCPVCNRKYGKE